VACGDGYSCAEAAWAGLRFFAIRPILKADQGKMTDQSATSDEMDTIGYAISFRIGAEALAPFVTVDGSKNEKNLVLSFYLLAGFSIENGLKSVLEFSRTDRSLRWAHSHDLSKLLRICRDAGFIVAPEVATFVDTISTHHKEHHFRYPQKAGEANLPNGREALALLEYLLSDAFQFIRGPVRLLRGYKEVPPT
jgi:hypothetical protein